MTAALTHNLMATPDSLNADIGKLISSNWSDISTNLSAAPKKSASFSVQVSLSLAEDGSISYVINNVYKKQAVVSATANATAKGKIS